jgi:hypothetical protein
MSNLIRYIYHRIHLSPKIFIFEINLVRRKIKTLEWRNFVANDPVNREK